MKKQHLMTACVLLAALTFAPDAFAKSHGHARHNLNTAAPTAMEADGTPVIRSAMMKWHDDNKALFEDMRARHMELVTIIKAPTFDRAAYLAKSAEIQAIHAQIAKTRTDMMADTLAKLTPEQRAKMADRPMMMAPRAAKMHDGHGPHGAQGGMGMQGKAPCTGMMGMDPVDGEDSAPAGAPK